DPQGRGPVRRPRLMLSAGDSARVAELMRETAAAELLLRFRALAKHEIRLKKPGDFVTVADELSEQRLAAGLARILPGVTGGGEGGGSGAARADRTTRGGLLGGRSAGRHGELRRRQGTVRDDRLPGGGYGGRWRLDPRRAARAHGGGVARAGRHFGWRVRSRRGGQAAADRGRRLDSPQGVRPPAAGRDASPARAFVDPELRRRRIPGDAGRPRRFQPLPSDQALGPCRRHTDAARARRRRHSLWRRALCARPGAQRWPDCFAASGGPGRGARLVRGGAITTAGEPAQDVDAALLSGLRLG